MITIALLAAIPALAAGYLAGRWQAASRRVDHILATELRRPALNDQTAADRAEAGDQP